MIRTFCDNCGKEMVGSNDPALLDKLLLPTGLLRESVKLSLAPRAVKNVYGRCNTEVEHICFGCIADAVERADEREKPPEAKPPIQKYEVENWCASQGYSIAPRDLV